MTIRTPRRSRKRPAGGRHPLDTLAGVTLWLTLTPGLAGTGVGLVLGGLSL